MLPPQVAILLFVLFVCVSWIYLQDTSHNALLEKRYYQQKLERLERSNNNDSNGSDNGSDNGSGLLMGKHYYRLHQLYYNNGDPNGAILYLIKAFQVTGDWAILYKIAFINHYGMANFSPNYEYARKYYQTIIENCPADNVRVEAIKQMQALPIVTDKEFVDREIFGLS
jgi:tetratricopeptide (TPR) repeat protein